MKGETVFEGDSEHKYLISNGHKLVGINLEITNSVPTKTEKFVEQAQTAKSVEKDLIN